VQRLEFEREMRKEGYRKKPVGLAPGRQAQWVREMARLNRRIDFLRRDPRLTAIDLRIEPNPKALKAFERDVLNDPDALRGLLEFEAEMRKLGCPTIILWAPLLGAPLLFAVGQDDCYTQRLRGGSRSRAVMQWAPTPVGLGLMPLVPPDWPPPERQ
jgi:hypothetical protein